MSNAEHRKVPENADSSFSGANLLDADTSVVDEEYGKTPDAPEQTRMPRVKGKARGGMERADPMDYYGQATSADSETAAGAAANAKLPVNEPVSPEQANIERWQSLSEEDQAREKELAETVAYQERTARQESGSFDRSDAARAEFEHVKSETSPRAEALRGVKNDLLDPQALSKVFEKKRQERIEQAQEDLNKVVEEGNKLGNKAADQFLDRRQQTSRQIAEYADELDQFERAPASEGPKVVAEAIKADKKNGLTSEMAGEMNMAIMEAFKAMTGQEDDYFMQKNVMDSDSGVYVKELYYHTEDPNQIVVERWNNDTGKPISSSVLKTEEAPTKVIADPDSHDVLKMLRGSFRQLTGREPRKEKLTAEAQQILDSDLRGSGKKKDEEARKRTEQSYASSSDTGGDYGTSAYSRFETNLSRLQVSPEAIKRVKPKKRLGFMAFLLDRIGRT